MPRSLKKGPYVASSILRKLRNPDVRKKVIQTRARSSMIIPEMIGYTFAIHTGNKFVTLHITELHIGYKLGEFAATRTFKGHPGDKKTA